MLDKAGLEDRVGEAARGMVDGCEEVGGGIWKVFFPLEEPRFLAVLQGTGGGSTMEVGFILSGGAGV